MTDLPWVIAARASIGLKEIAGPKHEGKILSFWKKIFKPEVVDDETPWCAAFVGACLEAAGLKSTRSGWARQYLNWGVRLTQPTYGCIVVFSREGGGGHVGFAVGRDNLHRLMVLGGNQGNEVSIKPFETSRVLGYRWPGEEPVVFNPLPLMSSSAASSKEEV